MTRTRAADVRRARVGEGVDHVDVALTDDQELFRDTTRRFLEAECPITEVRRLEGDPVGFDPGWWRRGADLGWTSLLVGESDGGGSISGHGLLDLVVVAGEMGRLVSPGPLLPVNVVASAVAMDGTAQQRSEVLPGLLGGGEVAAWAGSMRRRGSGAGINAVRTSTGVVLNGRAAPVEAAAQARWLLLTLDTVADHPDDGAAGDDGPTQVIVSADLPGIRFEPLESIDLVRRFAAVVLDDVEVPEDAVLGRIGGAAAALDRQVQVAVVLQCAETCGAMQRVFDLTVEYMAERYSFGRPLASYQALKHRVADSALALEACHGITAAAAEAVDAGAADAAEIVSAAKAFVASRSTELVQDSVQLHGGIGVTWEHDLHLYLRRVTLNKGMYGSLVEHRERIAELLCLGESAR